MHCKRKSARIISFNSKAVTDGTCQPIVAEFEWSNGNIAVSSFSESGLYYATHISQQDLMMRDDDYLERLDRGEYGDHIADASKMIGSLVKQNLITETPTCRDSLQVHKGIIDTLKRLDWIIDNIEGQVKEIIIDTTNASRNVQAILKKLEDYETQKGE